MYQRTNGARRRLILLSGLAAVLVALAVVFIVTRLSARPAVVANNVSRNFRVCLLTRTAGAADPTDAQTAQAVWAGLQQAAATGRVNAERLPIATADTAVATALPYFNGAVQQHCGLIVSVGAAMSPAVNAAAAAAANSGQKFLIVGAASNRGNVTGMPVLTAGATTAKVYSTVMDMTNG